ncbi:DNA fragmentation factor subunit beta [Condylostylus longicornis]|uniref:DNA fragmentation factor subunit beta n=1 Tax=Condylostylus longicornis TaxID=2530218 RepID=UPI00244DF63C|nr:DNA fragmentation factor subunit beta [Condylostylus longicornis]
MISFFQTPKEMKGYKITDNQRSRKYGIGANSLKMLKEKAKLKFPIKDLRLYMAKDGFEVSDEDYFETVEPQTLFVVAGPDEEVTTESDLEYQRMKAETPMLQIADIVYDFIEKNPEKFRKIINEYEKRKPLINNNEKTLLSRKSDHSEWFEGSEDRCQTKEEAMARRSQDRIRGYYYKTKDELTKCKLYRTNPKARQIIEKILEKFRYLLIGCDYFSMLFDRSCPKKHEILKEFDEIDARGANVPNKKIKQMIKEYTIKTELLDEWTVSLCTERGDFYCHGPFSSGVGKKENKTDRNGNNSSKSNTICNNKHQINPYASRENLILFQVWNLDHQIELSRTILPSLIENIRQLVEETNLKCKIHKRKQVVDISVLEYFLEIFSVKNLKLVHIVCHEKCQRANKSNGRLICEDCDEYKILKELSDISCPEEVDAC